jgi:hypothetical protein
MWLVGGNFIKKRWEMKQLFADKPLVDTLRRLFNRLSGFDK